MQRYTVSPYTLPGHPVSSFSRMRNDQDRVLGGAQAGWGRKGQGELPVVVGGGGRRALEDLAYSLERGG